MASIRLADDSDNSQLLNLEKMCPQGTSLVLSFDRSPDFFARSRVYKDYSLYVADENGKVVGTVGVTAKQFNTRRETVKGIYVYDLRVNPRCLGKGIGSRLVQHAMTEQGEADLAYGVIMGDNYPSIGLFRKLGFQSMRGFTLFSIPVFKRSACTTTEVRPLVSEDVPQVVDLLNSYYSDHDFFAKLTEDDFLERTKKLPGYSLANLQVVEIDSKIQACAGLWDYSKIFSITALHVSAKLTLLRYLLKFIGVFKNTMQMPSVGEPFKISYMRDFAFVGEAEMATEFVKHCLCLAYSYNCSFLTFALDPAESIIPAVSRYNPVRTTYQIYAKSLSDRIMPSPRIVYVDPMDL